MNAPFLIYAALCTPFLANGGVDIEAFTRYVQYLAAQGLKRMVLAGTTGQFASMTRRDRLHLLEVARAQFPGEIIFNISATAAADVISYAKQALEYEGQDGKKVDGFILLPPYYDAGWTQEGLYLFFFQVLSALREFNIPVMLYNFPRHTNTTLSPKLVARLHSEFPFCNAIKDSCGSFESGLGFSAGCPGVQIFMGNDFDAQRAAEANMAGAIWGGTGVFPGLIAKYEDAWIHRNTKEVTRLQALVNLWCTKLGEWNKAWGYNEKAILAAALGALDIGFPIHVAPPLHPVTNEHAAQIRQFYMEVQAQI